MNIILCININSNIKYYFNIDDYNLDVLCYFIKDDRPSQTAN